MVAPWIKRRRVEQAKEAAAAITEAAELKDRLEKAAQAAADAAAKTAQQTVAKPKTRKSRATKTKSQD